MYRCSRRGFALSLVLTFIVFVFLLVVSVATLTIRNQALAHQSETVIRARQAAMAGLVTAQAALETASDWTTLTVDASRHHVAESQETYQTTLVSSSATEVVVAADGWHERQHVRLVGTFGRRLYFRSAATVFNSNVWGGIGQFLDVAGPPLNSKGPAQVIMQNGSTLLGDLLLQGVRSAAPPLILSPDSSVTGNILDTRGTNITPAQVLQFPGIQTWGTMLAQITEARSNAGPPTTTNAGTMLAGMKLHNLNLNSGQKQSLAPGLYGDVTVAGDSTLTLQSGLYLLAALHLEPGSTLNAGFDQSGQAEVLIARELDAKGASFTNFIGSEALVFVGIPSQFNNPNVASPPGPPFTFTNSSFNGLLAAPQSTITLGRGTQFSGAVACEVLSMDGASMAYGNDLRTLPLDDIGYVTLLSLQEEHSL